MNGTSLIPQPRFLLTVFAIGCAGLAVGLRAQPRGDPPVVVYEPSITQIQGVLPFSYSYPLSIKSPNTILSGSSVTTTFSVTVIAKPDGVTDATAISYLSFSPATLNYTDPVQIRNVTVTLSVPAGAAQGSYGYQVYAMGWPGTATNFGTSINATITQTVLPVPPTVIINSPADGALIKVTSFPASIPLNYTASASADWPITGTTADYRPVGALTGTPVALNTWSPGASVTTGGTMTISASGWYSVTARGSNNANLGTAEDTNTFQVLLEPSPPPPPPAYVTGVVFRDLDADGIRDTGEPGEPNVTVTLYTLSGTFVAHKPTASDGSYSFDASATATYVVIATLPSGAVATTPIQVQGTTNTPMAPIGLTYHGFVTGVVFRDTNGNGIRDTGELGEPNVVVTLTSSSSSPVSQHTTASGTYSFLVTPGVTYTVTATLPSGAIATTPLAVSGTSAAPLHPIGLKYPTAVTIKGLVFLDVKCFGTYENEPGLKDIKLSITPAAGSTTSVITAEDGTYSFVGQTGVNYTIEIVGTAATPTTTPGLIKSAPTATPGRTIASSSHAPNPVGLKLDFCAIRGMKANGFTIGYWKKNIDKGGMQVSWAFLTAATALIADPTFALGGTVCFQGITPSGASAVMGASTSKPTELLRKQLLASEYNYCNGAYFNGTHAAATYAFICYGEYIAKNSTNSTEILLAKDRFDAYNNSHGSTIGGP